MRREMSRLTDGDCAAGPTKIRRRDFLEDPWLFLCRGATVLRLTFAEAPVLNFEREGGLRWLFRCHAVLASYGRRARARLRRSSIMTAAAHGAEPRASLPSIMPGLERPESRNDLWVPQRGIQFVYLVLLLPS